MSIVYWNLKQVPLKPEEVDGNFAYLEKRVEAIYELLKQLPALTSIEIKEGHLFLKGSDGSELSPIKLPSWNARGKWKSDTSYLINDIVYYDNCLYICLNSCTNSCPPAHQHWSLVFSLNA